MISREQVAEHRKLVEVYERIPKDAAIELLNTLDAALKVVEAAKETLIVHDDIGMYINPETGERTEYQKGWNAAVIACNIDAIEEALAPFTAPRGKE